MGRRQLVEWLGAALAFGVLMAVVKGQDTGVRDALGNTSAPWVLIPFLAGTRCRGVGRATLVGVATTLVSLIAFYTAEAAVLDLGPHPWYIDLKLTLGSGHVYEAWGIASGALYGAVGGLWRSRARLLGVSAVGLAFVCEPLIVLFLTRAGIWGGGLLFDYPWLWAGEVVLGLAIIARSAAAVSGQRNLAHASSRPHHR